VIGLANGFQSGLKQLIILQPLSDFGLQLRPNTELSGDFTGIANSENPNGMATTGEALRATLFVPDGAAEKRTAEDLGDRREAASQFATELERLLMFHHIYRNTLLPTNQEHFQTKMSKVQSRAQLGRSMPETRGNLEVGPRRFAVASPPAVHSQTFPSTSYSPQAFGRFLPTAWDRPPELARYQRYRLSAASRR